MRNPCQMETLLSAFIDGELSERDAQRVTQHLGGCTHCRQKLAELNACDGLVRGLDTIEPSADFERSFWRQVADLEDRQQARWWTRLFQPGWRPVLATGLTAGLIAGVVMFSNLEKEVSPEDRYLAENVEFFNDFELLDDLEILQNWEALEAMKELS